MIGESSTRHVRVLGSAGPIVFFRRSLHPLFVFLDLLEKLALALAGVVDPIRKCRRHQWDDDQPGISKIPNSAQGLLRRFERLLELAAEPGLPELARVPHSGQTAEDGATGDGDNQTNY